MKEEIMEHILDLKEQGSNVKIDEDRINYLIKTISDKKEKIYKEKKAFKNFLDKYQYDADGTYNKKN